MKFKRLSLFLLCAVLSFNSCIKEEIVGVKNEEEGKSGNKILSFELRNIPSSVDVSTDINHEDSSISISMNGLISYYDLKGISPSISVSKGAEIRSDELKDFINIENNPITYTVISESGKSREYKVKITYELKKFISKWEGSNMIKLPIYKGGDYDFVVDWGDGSEKERVTSFDDLASLHEYETDGSYTITITGKIEGFSFGKVETSSENIINIEDWGDLKLLNSAYLRRSEFYAGYVGVFEDCTKLVSLPLDSPNLEGVTDVTNMFEGTTSFNGDISKWDVSKVTNMIGMFKNAKSFNGDISKWDVSNVTNMSGMFEDAVSFNQNIGGWNVGNVTDMSSMFYGGYKAKIAMIFNQDISGWDVSNVTNMSSMFERASHFNQNLNKWNVGNVTSMGSMFKEATSFSGDISNWKVGNVTNMSKMFSGGSFGTIPFNGDITEWDVSNVTDMSNMFEGAENFNQNIGGWNVGSVTNMFAMFCGAITFNQDISGWDVSRVTNMRIMFSGCWPRVCDKTSSFEQDLSGWDVSNVTECSSFSRKAPKITEDKKPNFVSNCNTNSLYYWMKGYDDD
ncbi:BspA family leucine-rich repeat surface protein [Ichthyobacterium seriolicida]|uniref:PKD domain-containing protein n=1 Tax=Ichthyobacterium seriolicida TaxID=242600 RepID=A0A1J1E1E1_9FLAO|nr:BspA family leucine-rich repeat surface protein [Ichthyobacterium seriolicida]BAV94765.1 hypothetical protein JBKA6_0752 [Ichthyobacterium seriolicida]